MNKNNKDLMTFEMDTTEKTYKLNGIELKGVMSVQINTGGYFNLEEEMADGRVTLTFDSKVKAILQNAEVDVKFNREG